MRLLADENVPGPLVRALVESGCDVAWVRTVSPGVSDPEVLALAMQEKRILLTFDKDFGEIAKREAARRLRRDPRAGAHAATARDRASRRHDHGEERLGRPLLGR
jgi:hypothetical protein